MERIRYYSTSFQADVIDELQLEEEAVAVIDMSDGFPESIGGIGKVNFDVGGVLVLGEFLCDSGLAVTDLLSLQYIQIPSFRPHSLMHWSE